MAWHSTLPGTKTFILGVGCQKGGTSWLHRFLSSLPAADMGFLKEYHVWDALHLSHCEVFRQLAREWPHAGATGIPWPLLDDVQHARRLRSFHEDVANYFAFFAERLQTADVTGDLTPSYGMLRGSVYRKIRAGFAGLGIEVKVVFLLRDPVERICSHVRKSRNPLITADEDLRDRYRRPNVRARTAYEETLRNLQEAFPPDLVHCELYERLFTESAMGRLCDFLGVRRVAADFQTRVNASDGTIDFDEELKREVAMFYKQTYTDVAIRFGAVDVLQLWPRASEFIRVDAEPARRDRVSGR